VIENLKSSKRKENNSYKENPVSISADFSAETLQARKQWHDIFKVLKEKKSVDKNTLFSNAII